MSVAWCNGEVLQSDVQLISLRNRGLTLGDGLFETVLVANGVALWIDAHLNRLIASAEVLDIAVTREDIARGITDVLQQGSKAMQVLRITVTRGDTARGLAGKSGPAHVFMTLDSFDAALIGQPVTLCTSTVARSAVSISSTHKTLSYVDAVFAAREAEAAGCGDALMLNTQGNVASTTIANIFMVKGNRLITPSRDQGILPGIVRQEILNAATALGFIGEERVISPQEIHSSDGVFLCNSLRLQRTVTALDGKPLPAINCAAILDHLYQKIQTYCGNDPSKF